MNIHRRIQTLEERAARTNPPERPEASRKLVTVLDELARLRASGATHYRAGERIEGVDIPRQLLGPDYCREDLVELAVSRAADAGAFDRNEVPGIVPAMKANAERRST